MSRHNRTEGNIENPRNHPQELIEKLQCLLKSGAQMQEDPRRPDFFELADQDRVFYIYVSPATGTVIFLATWVLELEAALAN